jgi:hydrogenase maturation protease
MERAPILVFAYGNPSRGDDALGPVMYDLLYEKLPDEVELLTDFQLQIEHSMDLDQREAVLFIDASMSATAPFHFYQLQAERDNSFTSHAMSPTSLLDAYQQVNQQQAPPSFMLEIRGYEFELGKSMTAMAEDNLKSAGSFLDDLLATEVDEWPTKQGIT